MSTTTQADLSVSHASHGSWYHSFTQAASTKYWAAVARISIGLVFLWAFLDKNFGLEYTTPGAEAWSFGTGDGDPTFGYLKFATDPDGPMAGVFTGLRPGEAPDAMYWTNWLFMLGLLGIGVALVLGVFMRIGAISGAVLLMLMYMADWPFGNGPDPETGEFTSHHPFVDDHLVYAIVLVMLMLFTAERTWGLGKWWQSTSIVQRFPWLA